MVARPTADPLFATDASYTGIDPWSGDPTRQDPGSPRRAQGFTPDTLPAEWLNWEIGIHGDWAKWFGALLDVNEEHTYQTAKARAQVLDLSRCNPGAGLWVWDPSTAKWTASGNFDSLTIPLSSYLRTGQTILDLVLTIDPGAARSGTNRMSLAVWKHVTNFATPGLGAYTQLGSTAYDDTTGSIQNLSVSGLTEVVDKTTTEYYAILHAGNNAATFNDFLYSARLDHLDIGPRNT